MIEVTDIGGNRLYINCDLIERMTTAQGRGGREF